MPLSLPVTQKVKDLQVTHPEYDARELRTHEDLYRGGKHFEARKRQYLRKRALDDVAGGKGERYLQARLRCASYTPHAAGIIDWLVAAAMQAEPSIGAKATDSKGKNSPPPAGGDKGEGAGSYWSRLNKDVDGHGQDFSALARDLFLELMVHKRAYVAVRFPKDEVHEGENLHRQLQRGGLDATFHLLKAREIDDWDFDDDGNLQWVRVHCVRAVRSSGAVGPRNKLLHTWTYLEDTQVVQYSATQDLDEQGKPKEFPEGTLAMGTAQPHSLNALPVVVVDVSEGMHVMGRLEAPALNLFNNDAGLDFSLAAAAYAQLVLKTEQDLSNVYASELDAIKLEPTGSAQYLESQGAHWNALKARGEKLKEDMFSAVQTMALVAAAKDSNGRQSGVAKFRDFGAIATLLSAFASKVRDALEAAVALVKKARNEAALEVSIDGLDKFDVQSKELKLKLAQEFLALTAAPETAKRYVLTQIALMMAEDAPGEVRDAIRAEASKLDLAPAKSDASGDAVGKVPLALQQLALAKDRMTAQGDAARAEAMGQKMDDLASQI